MAQTQTPALKFQDEDDVIDYTPASAVYSGDVVVIGSIPFVASVDIAANVKGSLATEGVWKLPKDTSTFSAGDAVYWNATGSPVTGTASTGAATSTASGANLAGMATLSALTGDTYVYVLLTAAKRTTTLGGAVTADSVTGTSSTLPVAGLASTQGGSASLVGGASSTSGNAGGAALVTGGAAGATGVGGAVTIAGAAGGASSGTGGAVTMTGGAGTAGNATGGAAGQTGGAGQGSAAGGAAVMTGGAGGLTGAGGAITITSGAGGGTSGAQGAINIACGSATSANGAAVTITAGNGAGGTNSGGNINLVPGTAVSTGIPGEVQVNSVAGTFEVTYTAPLMTTAVPASGTAQPIYIATRAMRLKKAYCSVVTHGTSETIQLTKDASAAAPGAGTAMLAAVMTPAANNTPVTQAASSTIATATLAAGDRISFLTGGTIGAAAGLTITMLFVPC
jgi:predicted RecA/RadA family phage recombinase